MALSAVDHWTQCSGQLPLLLSKKNVLIYVTQQLPIFNEATHKDYIGNSLLLKMLSIKKSMRFSLCAYIKKFRYFVFKQISILNLKNNVSWHVHQNCSQREIRFMFEILKFIKSGLRYRIHFNFELRKILYYYGYILKQLLETTSNLSAKNKEIILFDGMKNSEDGKQRTRK